MINIEPIIEKVRKSLDCHRTETGYARYPEKGDNEYEGNGGRKRQKKETHEQVVVKTHKGFDMKI